MRHRSKKIKFKGGKDATDMVARKLMTNFFEKGKLSTTLSKAKVLKSLVERMVEKAKKRCEANKNYLLKYGFNKKQIEFMFVTIGPALAKINGGYVRIQHEGFRLSDGADMAIVEWAYPIVVEKPIEEKHKDQSSNIKSNPKSK